MSDWKLQEVLQGIWGENSEKLVSALEEQAEIEWLKTPDVVAFLDSVKRLLESNLELCVEPKEKSKKSLFVID